jgi:uncharacterized protein
MRAAEGWLALPRLGVALALICGVCAVAPHAAAAWTPERATYGTGTEENVSITASDGTKLYANVYYPTDLKTGEAAAGPFPVLLTQTPYGKDNGNQNGYLVDRGYINVVADVRGTGTSEGEWGLFDPVQGTDGADWVNYAAGLPHSDGKVGLYGYSYVGINQFETAADAGVADQHRPGGNPVKAMFPIIAANELYRDTAFAGGFPDIEFDGLYLGLMAGLTNALPAAEGAGDLPTAESDHIGDLSSFDTELLTNVETGGDQAYDGTYWQQRSPDSYVSQIVKDHIPAFLVGGWYDLFLRGELLDYSSFQNAYDNRPLGAAMTASQRVTPRYQLLMGPWYHVTAPDGLDYHGLNIDGLQLAWFDHWLKGVETGVTDTATPMHLEDLATGSSHEASRYPLNQAIPTTYYLQSQGVFSAQKPASAGGSDLLAFTGSEIPCTSSTDQWSAGFEALMFQDAGQPTVPCTNDANLSRAGPGTQSYTTAPFTTPTTLAGPIGASLYASTTTKDAEWVVQLSDIAPNGQATSLTSGILEGDQRAVDTDDSWYAPDGNPLLPYHPYTQAAMEPITPGKLTRFDVEVFPTDDTLEPGHRLRVTIATSDFPHVLPEVAQLPSLIGGLYTLDHNSSGPSSVELPLIPASDPLPATSSTALGCPDPAGALTETTLDAASLGMSRTGVRSALVDSSESTHGRQAMQYYCLAGAGMRVGYTRGRASLLLSENSYYAIDGFRPQRPLPAGHRLVGYKVGANTWYLLALKHGGRGVLKVRDRTVLEVGVADPALVRTATATRRFFKSFD